MFQSLVIPIFFMVVLIIFLFRLRKKNKQKLDEAIQRFTKSPEFESLDLPSSENLTEYHKIKIKSALVMRDRFYYRLEGLNDTYRNILVWCYITLGYITMSYGHIIDRTATLNYFIIIAIASIAGFTITRLSYPSGKTKSGQKADFTFLTFTQIPFALAPLATLVIMFFSQK